MNNAFKLLARTAYGNNRLLVYPVFGDRVVVSAQRSFVWRFETRNGKRVKTECPILEGAVLVSKRDEQDYRRRIYLIYPNGIFEAVRGRLHAQERYGDALEKGETRELILSIREISELLALLYKYAKLTAEQKELLQQRIAKLAVEFEWCRNYFKKEGAYPRFLDSIFLEDSRGRPNPAVVSARLLAAQQNLDLRQIEIRKIAPWVGAWEVALINERARMLNTLYELWQLFGKIIGSPIFQERVPTPSDVSAVDLKLHQLLVLTKVFYITPFVSLRRRLQAEIEEARQEVDRGRYRTARRILDRSRESLRFKFAQARIEEVITRLSLGMSAGRLDHEAIGRLAEAVAEIISRLPKLRERGLISRPLKKVRPDLGLAHRSLAKGDLAEAKKALKRASHAL